MSFRAIRAATTLDVDSKEEMILRVVPLLQEVMDRNAITEDDLVSILFTATEDITSCFPATAARQQGFSDVPLICARELSIEGATPLCVRIMIHAEMDRPKSEVAHVYHRGAVGLRNDLSR